MTPPPDHGALDAPQQLIEQGRFAEAETLLRRLISRGAADVRAESLLAFALLRQNKLDQAEYFAQRVCAARKNDPESLCNLAIVMIAKGKASAVVEVLLPLTSSALPVPIAVAEQLCGAYNALFLGSESVELADRVLAAGASSEPLLAARSHALLLSGRADEGVSQWRDHLKSAGYPLHLLAGAVPLLPYAEHAGAEYAAELFKRFGRATRSLMGQAFAVWPVEPSPAKKLHVGLLSPDFRNHAMAHFIEPIIEGFDRQQWDVTLWTLSATIDEVTRRMRERPGVRFESLVGKTQRAAAERIRDMKTDVLIEFAGHTSGNPLQAMSLRPAPVSITAIGFPTTTGLDSIDFRLVDSITDPPGSEHFNSERLMRLDPCFIAFRPRDDSPPLAPPPSEAAGCITFGSFAAIQKLSEAGVRLWADVLKAVPHSRLLYRSHGTASPRSREALIARFEACAVPRDRLLIEPPAPNAAALLPSYQRVDIALDSFPYHGTTTTCEAALMGVPVVTLKGSTSAARVGCSILSALGLPDLIAKSHDEFVRIAADLARNSARLRELRSDSRAGLRARLNHGPLGDYRTYCASLQSLIRSAWQDWCKTQANSAATIHT